MKSVKAKFICSHISEGEYNNTANFYAVYSGEGENADFAKATPSGNLQINIDKGTPAASFFAIGKSYYLDITEVGS